MEVLFIYLWYVCSLPLKAAISIDQQQTWAIHFPSLPVIVDIPNGVSEAKLKGSGVQASPYSVPYVSYHCLYNIFPLWTPRGLVRGLAFSSIHNSCTRPSVNGQLHAPVALPPMKTIRFRWTEGWLGPRFWDRNIISRCQDSAVGVVTAALTGTFT
jgi:hypothetical protein